jgi:ribosome-associated protein
MTTPQPAPSDTSSRVREAVAAMLDKKALDLKVLYLGAISDFTDYFVIASGSSERQVQAIADGVEERLRELGLRPLSAEGQSRGQWVLLDYGAFLVHVFTEERRAFYGLERLWSDAPDATKELGG